MDEQRTAWRRMTGTGLVVRGPAELLGVLLTTAAAFTARIRIFDAEDAIASQERAALATGLDSTVVFRCPAPWRFDQGIYIEETQGFTIAAVFFFRKLPD